MSAGFVFAITNSHVCPVNGEESQKLFDIVSELAQNTNFGITTDFFTIGLDSLNIIQISSKHKTGWIQLSTRA